MTRTLFDSPAADTDDWDDPFGPPVVVRPPVKPVVAAQPVPTGKRYFVRDYQTRAVESVFAEWEKVDSTLLVMATGTGKTVCVGTIAERAMARWAGDVMFVAHRRELIDQAIRTFRGMLPGVRVEAEQGERVASSDARIVVASVQSLHPDRLAAFCKDRFSVLICDECHHVTSGNVSYKRLFDWFSSAKKCGVTATPDRSDEKALGQMFDSVAMVYDILDAKRDGWLVNIGQKLVTCQDLDLSGVRLNKDGDFRESDLAEAMKEERPLMATVEAAVKYSTLPTPAHPEGAKRPTLIFTASTDHARAVADMLNRRHARDGTGRAAYMDYKLDRDNPGLRDEIAAEYRRGNIRYLVNFGLYVEGTDFPDTAVVVIARLTKSRALYAQMCGRATRTIEELSGPLSACRDAAERRSLIAASRKPGALVIDVIGLNHKLVITSADILGGRYDDEAVEMVKSKMAKSDWAGDVEQELAKAQVEVEKAKRLAADRAKAAKRSGVVIKARLSERDVDPFDVLDAVAGREPGWFAGKMATDKQVEALKKFGVPRSDLEGITRHRASRLFETCVQRSKLGLCSYRQAKILKRFGFEINASRKAAETTIDSLKAAGWKRTW